jgi:hypothetical protein
MIYNKNVTRLTTQLRFKVVTNCHIMTVSDLLEQPCNKSDNIQLLTSCSIQTMRGLVDDLLADLLQDM